ncbi:MAG: GNAT family N-acetyltransferase [Prevotella sp.]|nr:GNAT family N-acetyltransferase [Prevotella sp.]
MMEVRRYTASDAERWNLFVADSRQGTFLFDRGYMDYHRSRFTDHSLLIYRKERLFALLPANADGDTLWSHQGLTYGGLLTNERATVADVCEAFHAINAYLRAEGFRRVVYKAIPSIYHRLPAEEDLYALTNICNARLTVRHVSSTLTTHRLSFTESRKSGLRKAQRLGIEVEETTDLTAFWSILEQNLQRQYAARPVHTLSEMELLHTRFPQNIRLFMASRGGCPLGGTLIFETPQVVHTQYISASEVGKREGALDALFDYLLHDRYAQVPYFDFGKSSDGDGHALNRSLIFQKEGFGGRAVCYDWYEYDI